MRLHRFAIRVRQRDGVDRDNVQAILAAVRTLGGAVSGTSASLPEIRTPVCTPLFELAVPLASRRGRRVAGRRTFESIVAGRGHDRDRMTLVCQP